MKYIKKPPVVEAYQWVKRSEHKGIIISDRDSWPFGNNEKKCTYCGVVMHEHGWCTTVDDMGDLVCPGDWVIKDFRGDYHSCKPDVFKRSYELEKI